MLATYRSLPFFTSCLIGFSGSFVAIWKLKSYSLYVNVGTSFTSAKASASGHCYASYCNNYCFRLLPNSLLLNEMWQGVFLHTCSVWAHFSTLILTKKKKHQKLSYFHFSIWPSRYLHNHVKELLKIQKQLRIYWSGHFRLWNWQKINNLTAPRSHSFWVF